MLAFDELLLCTPTKQPYLVRNDAVIFPLCDDAGPAEAGDGEVEPVRASTHMIWPATVPNDGDGPGSVVHTSIQ
jgi:hypothetical protein